MRSHGLPEFHNPIVAGRSITFTVTPDEPVHSPQYVRAEAACRDLLPAGLPVPGQALTVADQVHYLKAVACMRAHGFENFPDPSFTDGIAHFTPPQGVNENSPKLQEAFAACRKAAPVRIAVQRLSNVNPEAVPSIRVNNRRVGDIPDRVRPRSPAFTPAKRSDRRP